MFEKSVKKKTLSLNRAGLVLLAVLVVASFYVWQAGNKVRARVEAVSANVTAVMAQTRTIAEPSANLTVRLDAAKTALASAQAGVPSSIDRNALIDFILKSASDYNIQVLPINTDGLVTQNFGLDYQVLKLSVTAQGILKDVESFIKGLQAGAYSSLVVSSFTITRQAHGVSGFPGDEMNVSANIKISVYAASKLLTEASFK